jgi:hypothetical protein
MRTITELLFPRGSVPIIANAFAKDPSSADARQLSTTNFGAAADATAADATPAAAYPRRIAATSAQERIDRAFTFWRVSLAHTK